MTTKQFVLDTNVLLNDPRAPYAFENHSVVIPMAVLEELDNIKMKKVDLSRDARAAIRTINDILGDGDAGSGVNFGIGSIMVVMGDIIPIESNHVQFLPNDSNDNKIINTALALHHQTQEVGMKDNVVVMVSNDINLRLKTKASGLSTAQEYQNEIVVEDTDLLPKGYVEVPNSWMDGIDSNKITFKSCGEAELHYSELPENIEYLTVNTWLIPEDKSWVGKIVDFDNDLLIAKLRFENVGSMHKRRCSGIFPKDIYQAICIDALLDDNIDIVVIDGAAGSGKTLLTMAAATEMVKGKRSSYRMDEVIFTRTNDTQFKEIGFLKGDEHEKMAPWLAAVYDNMEVVARESKNAKFHPSKSIEGTDDEGFIRLKSMNFMRGRSLNHKVLVIDEAQNMTVSQMKTILTRAGEYCKVVVLGNLGQIDNEFVTARSSGLTYATQKLHGQEFCQVIQLQGIKRSRLAEYVELNFA